MDDTESSEICESDSSSSFQFSDGVASDQRNQIAKRNKKEKLQKNRQMRFNPMSTVAAFRKLNKPRDKTIANMQHTFSNISLQNSSQPLFGTQVIYNGSVTIQNFYGEKRANFEMTKNEDNVVNLNGEANHTSSLDMSHCSRTNKEHVVKLSGKANNTSSLDVSHCSKVAMQNYKHCSELAIHGYKLFTSETGDKLLADGKAPFLLVPKWMWLAREPNFNISSLPLPATRVIIAHTQTQEYFTVPECCNTVKSIQTTHMDVFGWADIGFHFLVGGDGSIYHGRGWGIVGAHTKGYNQDSICIAFIGTFDNSPPPDRQLNIAQQFLENAVNDKKLIPNYKLYGQCQLAPYSSPGKKLFEKIQTWPNWTNEL